MKPKEPLTVKELMKRLSEYNPKAVVGTSDEVSKLCPDGFMPFTWIGGHYTDKKIILE